MQVQMRTPCPGYIRSTRCGSTTPVKMILVHTDSTGKYTLDFWVGRCSSCGRKATLTKTRPNRDPGDLPNEAEDHYDGDY